MKIALVLSFSAVVCLAADTGRLTTKVNPGRAGIMVDGKFVGPAGNMGFAQTYALPAGEHEIRLVEPRYEEVVKKVTITAGKKSVLNESMKALAPAKPPFGTVKTHNADHFAAVYVNGKYMGHVDEFDNFAQGLLLNPGTYEVKIVPVNGTGEVTKTITVVANQTVVVQ